MSTVTRSQRDSEERVDLDGLIAELIADPDRWKETPNDVLGGRRPGDLIGTDQEGRLRELLYAIRLGIPT
jgi:hypothetical protein